MLDPLPKIKSPSKVVSKMALRKCSRCGLPETYETIEFDDFGVCNICLQHRYKTEEIDWNIRRKMLDDIVAEYKGKGQYDCVVPFSGGKDSTFTLLYIVNELKLKPLVVQFNHGFLRPGLLRNNERTFKQLGVDVLSFTPNWKLVKLLMKESLMRKGDFCWHCHTGIFSYPMHVAIKFDVPLIFWGEPSSEYTAYYDYRSDELEMVDEERFNKYINLGLTGEDMKEIIAENHDIDPRDFEPYIYPRAEQVKTANLHSVTLGSFIPWNTRKQSELIMRELGWSGDEVEGMPPGRYDYEKIECFMQGSRDYLKFLKRGYSRVTQMTALDLRNGVISEEDAQELVREFEGKRPPSLDILLGYLEMSEDEFNEIATRMSVPPHQPFFETIPVGIPTGDLAQWYREK